MNFQWKLEDLKCYREAAANPSFLASMFRENSLMAILLRGGNEEGWNGPRYGRYHDLESWTKFMVGTGFEPIGHYYRPKGLPRDQQPWLASTFRKA